MNEDRPTASSPADIDRPRATGHSQRIAPHERTFSDRVAESCGSELRLSETVVSIGPYM